MSDSFAEQLSKFTPSAGRLDRDALLFEAGRNSARPNRIWQGASLVLGSTQLLMLALIWPQPVDLAPSSQDLMVRRSNPAAPVEQPSRDEPVKQHIWSVRHIPDELMLDDVASKSIVLSDTEPELRAFGLPADSTLN